MADELESSVAALLEFQNGHKMSNEVEIKQETVDDEDNELEDEDFPILGPAALGLQRVGTQAPPKPSPTQPQQVLNARGMPARIRKKNKLFFDDDIVNTPHHRVPSAKKQKPSSLLKKPKTPTISKTKDSRSSPKKSKDTKAFLNHAPVPMQVIDKQVGQKIGLRLRNLLKLPKAHKWVIYEWFYSDIDRSLFAGENDFSICLKESFPELKSRELTRIEWTKIRRMMGKPRRCSQAFFNEERLELEKKRKKIRALQQRKVTDTASFKDLPAEVPMQLVIGTKVTARLRKPQDGLFTGSIDAVDTSNNTYRITFERPGLGTHSVPDYEVLSNEPPDTISISTFHNKFRPRNGMSLSVKNPSFNLKLKNDPLLADSAVNKPSFIPPEGRIGGFPAKLLEKMVLVTKILNVKKAKIKLLKCMNGEAEKLKSFEAPITEDFKRKYASILFDLEVLNTDLYNSLENMQELIQEMGLEPSVSAMLTPSYLREKCFEEAADIVRRQSSNSTGSKTALELVTELTALMLQVKNLANTDQTGSELKILHGTMEQIKRKLSPENQQVFQSCVEVHMKHLEDGLAQLHVEKL